MELATCASTSAPHALGSNVVTPEGTVYTITKENNQTVRRPYTSSGAFLSYSYNSWETINGASAEDMALPVGSYISPQDGKIICSDRGSDKGTCYLITGSKKAGFTSASVFTELGYNFKYVISGDVSFLSSTANIDTPATAHKPGTLINKDGTVYLVANSGILGLPSWDTLKSWGYSSTDIVPANSADRNLSVVGNLVHKQPEQISVNPATPPTTTTPNPTPSPTITNLPSSGLKLSFSANGTTADNGLKNITVNPGDWVSFHHTVSNAVSIDSYYSTDSADTCSGDFSSGKLITTWIVNSANGLAQWYADNCRAGHTYIFTVRGSNPSTNPTIAVETVVVKVNPINSYTLSQPVITGQTSVLVGTSNLYSAIAYGKSFTSNLGYYIDYTFDWGDGSPKESKSIESGYSIYHIWQNSGMYTITVTATDSLGKSTSKTLSVKVSTPASPLSISTGILPSAFTGDSYSFQLQASGGTAPYKWGLGTGGTLPCCWLNLTQDGVVTAHNGSVGQLVGNNLVRQWKVSVYVTDAYGQTTTKNMDWQVKPSIKIQTSVLGTAEVNSYMFKDINYLYFSDYPSLNTMTFSGLPPGISVDALDNNQVQSGPNGNKASFANPTSDGTRTFRLTGTPTQSGTYTINIIIADSAGTASVSKQFTLVVNP